MADWRPIIKCRDDGFPRIMGVINVTPDSFFEKSRAGNLDEILQRAIFMSENGADWIDIGGESTRPGAKEVALKEELDRVSKAIEIIRDELPDIGISVDTRKSEVAMNALKYGADMINDISSLSDPEMKNVILEYKCPICIMHMKGNPGNMQNNPIYEDVVKEVKQYLRGVSQELIESGVESKNIINDPGIGFGKLLEHNLKLLSAGREIISDNSMPLMWGVSRKKMFDDLLGRNETKNRLAGTLGIAAMAPTKEVDIIRVHDVPEHLDLFRSMAALEEG
ncbi:MAG: dihydropteroate synthase [Euryarchaeota archaeon]|nr:dihydropteroate synthase [Euryarchaeota archaeon]